MRNHDEWSLDKLSEAERQEVFATFGPEADMQLFSRGLPPPALDARGRPGADANGVQSHVLAAGRQSCSTARRSAWPRTSRSMDG